MRKSDTRCESKQECSSSKADELKVEFSAEWLRIWRYERGIRENLTYVGSKTIENKEKRTWIGLRLRRLFNLCDFDLGRVDCTTQYNLCQNLEQRDVNLIYKLIIYFVLSTDMTYSTGYGDRIVFLCSPPPKKKKKNLWSGRALSNLSDKNCEISESYIQITIVLSVKCFPPSATRQYNRPVYHGDNEN